MTWQSHNKCPPSWENINTLLVMLTWVDPIMLMGCSHHRIQTILAAPTSMFLRSLWTVEQNIYDIWHCKQLQTRGTWTLKDLPLLCINIIFKLKREHVCIIYALNHSRVLINLILKFCLRVSSLKFYYPVCRFCVLWKSQNLKLIFIRILYKGRIPCLEWVYWCERLYISFDVVTEYFCCILMWQVRAVSCVEAVGWDVYQLIVFTKFT